MDETAERSMGGSGLSVALSVLVAIDGRNQSRGWQVTYRFQDP